MPQGHVKTDPGGSVSHCQGVRVLIEENRANEVSDEVANDESANDQEEGVHDVSLVGQCQQDHHDHCDDDDMGHDASPMIASRITDLRLSSPMGAAGQ